MNGVPPARALYYPHAEFGSTAWVKSALLYWDGIARLAPVPPRDDPEIRELMQARLIEDIDPAPFLPAAAEDFGERLESLVCDHAGELSRIPRARYIRGRDSDELVRHRSQVAEAVRAQGRHRAADAIGEGLLEDASATLTVFATALACVVARRRNLSAITDDPTFQATTAYLEGAEEGPGREPHDAGPVKSGLAAAELLVPTPSPEAVGSLSVERLLAIREHLAGARTAFRTKIEGHVSAIESLPNERAIRDHLKELAEDLHDELEAQRRVMKEANVQGAWSFLSITVRISLAAGVAAALSSPMSWPLEGIGAVAVSLTTWFFARKRAKRDHGHYVLAVENALAGKDRGALEAGLDRLRRR
jgi:hypothetical protein